MNIHFNLKDAKGKVSPIRVIITHQNKVYRKAVGLSCKVSDWSKTKEKTGNLKTDEALKKIRIALETSLDEFSTPERIKAALDYCIEHMETMTELPKGSEPVRIPTFMEVFKEWSERPSSSIRQHRLAYNNVAKLMGKGLDWDDIDETFHYRLVTAMEDAGWGVNYQGNMIKAVKAVMKIGYKQKYHRSKEYEDFENPHGETDAIYLNAEEMERIWNYESKSVLKCKSRDMAWLGYLTLARFSDYSRMSEENIGADGILRFSQDKTTRPVVVPCSPRLREIFARNGGKAPVICHQKFNEYIKKVCRECGIDDMVEMVKVKGREKVREAYRKYELVSSHTFRRSAATNLYLQGVPLRSIQQLTGHSTITMLEKYLKVGKEENAMKMADNPFFTQR